MPLPSDILAEINRRFPVKAERAEARKLLGSLWRRPLNVGPAQLARAVLLLAEGQLATLKGIVKPDFDADPRDILLRANDQSGHR